MWRRFDMDPVVAALSASGGRLVAGAAGLHRQVDRALLASSIDELRTVDADVLVITTEDLLLSLGPDDAVTDLRDAGVAAIAVRLDGPDPLHPALVEAADQGALPMVTFPATSSVATVTAAVLDALLEAQGERLERFLDIHQRFTPVVLAGGGPQEIAATLYQLLELPIVILDTNGRVVVSVPDDMDTADLEGTGLVGVRQPILAGEHDYGQIVVLNGGVTLDDDQRLALERASAALAVRQAHASLIAADQERFAATTLEELIAGHAGTTVDVIERALSFGWDLSRPRAVLLASIDPPIDTNTARPALSTIAAAARATLGPEAIVWTRTSTIAVLIAPPSGSAAARRALADELRGELDRRLGTVTVSIGVGRMVDDPSNLSQSYVEASRAVDVGRWAKGRHVTEIFDELGLERLLASTPSEDLAGFVEQAIGALHAYDRDHDSQLVETLGVWLETRNMARAATLVHVHYNTFKNRLDRIESILGPVTTDAAQALECAVAIYIARNYDGPWTTSPTM